VAAKAEAVSDHLLPRFRAHQEAVTVLDGRNGRAPREAVVPEIVNPGAGMHADPLRMRGIPVIGGCAGASPGTNPLAAWLRKERLAEEQRGW
jgi:hypothetical protein